MIAFQDLFCNGRKNPVGIGTDLLLQWNYTGGGRGVRQSSYRVVVKDGESVVFDSGAILSDEMSLRLPPSFLSHERTYRWTVEAVLNGKTVRSPEQTFYTATGRLTESGFLVSPDEPEAPAAAFARTFSVKKPLAGAKLSIGCKGMFTVDVNGVNPTGALRRPTAISAAAEGRRSGSRRSPITASAMPRSSARKTVRLLKPRASG